MSEQNEFKYQVTPEIAAEYMGLSGQPPPVSVGDAPYDGILLVRRVADLPVPVPGSTQQQCTVCGEPVWVSSQSPLSTRICTVCHEAQGGQRW